MSQNRDAEKLVQQFLKQEKGEFSEIRTVLIFGRNSSTYKFAFCHALLQQKAVDSLKYEDIKGPMLDIFIERYKQEKRQFTLESTNFTRKLDVFLEGKITREELDQEAEKVIFNNVLDAFQNVGGSSLDSNHKLFDHEKNSKRIILRDTLKSLLSNETAKKELLLECSNRWSIVEKAWSSNLSPNLIYDPSLNAFCDQSQPKRVSVRSALHSLLPYQKGTCFYCSRPLVLDQNQDFDSFPDVDHFIPFSHFRDQLNLNPNGVWNLVIACRSCNRGPNGKFDKIPAKNFFDKLLARNLYLAIEHKHALKTSILISLGVSSPPDIKNKMQMIYNRLPISKWSPL